jgi:hypothetical protein
VARLLKKHGAPVGLFFRRDIVELRRYSMKLSGDVRLGE